MSVSEALGEQKEIRLAQGTVRYREAGSGEPIVFVHGILVNGDLWRKVVPGLSNRFRCVTPDLPLGAHEPTYEPHADLSPPGVAALLADFIDALGLDNVTLVANDTGGAISQMLIAARPERIARLVLTNCDAFSHFPPLLLKPLPLLSRIPGFMFVAAKALNLPPSRALLIASVSKTSIERKVQRSYFEPAAFNADVRRDFQKFLRDTKPEHTKAAATLLPQFDRPVLIAWAPKDSFFPKKIAEQLAHLFPNATLEWIDDSLLFVPQDQPEKLTRLVTRFVAAVGPAAEAVTASAAPQKES